MNQLPAPSTTENKPGGWSGLIQTATDCYFVPEVTARSEAEAWTRILEAGVPPDEWDIGPITQILVWRLPTPDTAPTRSTGLFDKKPAEPPTAPANAHDPERMAKQIVREAIKNTELGRVAKASPWPTPRDRGKK